jgi:hypothetical protein
MSAPFDAELHAICDQDMQSFFDAIRKGQDPRMVEYVQAREKDWNCWQGFPDRWKHCRTLEKLRCDGDPELAAGAHKMMAIDCGKHRQGDPNAKFDAEECAASQNLAAENDPDPARCENVKQLDGLMPRFEAAMQENGRLNEERENESLRALENTPPPPPAPSFTTTHCEPNLFGGGFTCNSDSF